MKKIWKGKEFEGKYFSQFWRRSRIWMLLLWNFQIYLLNFLFVHIKRKRGLLVSQRCKHKKNWGTIVFTTSLASSIFLFIIVTLNGGTICEVKNLIEPRIFLAWVPKLKYIRTSNFSAVIKWVFLYK